METNSACVETFEVNSEILHPANDAIAPLTIEQLMMVGGGECVVNAI